MKINYNQFLLSLAGIVGATGFSFLVTLPSGAKEAVNPNPSIFNEAPYNRSQRIEVNAEYTSAESVSETAKERTSNRNLVAQKPKKRTLNPRPSIFNEPPYNRGDSAAPSPSSSPATTPTTQPRQTPSTTIPTQTPGRTTNTQGKNLVVLAESNGSFTTLTKALKAAGLAEALQGNNNFTIFAPTDAAFSKLPQDAVQDLLKPENKEVLVKILTYHVVPGRVLASDLKSGEVKSIEGGAINIKVDPTTGVKVNEANVTQPDITGSNGVIHAIDQVILPPDL
ncbi:MAG: fasciclin domain-containing protein [Mojavia pulchra JT2-VF2]|jgi:uncharacterized surface protein with fasciclin (FAS1) repeats|uniref:Fasciclin domain-containing protein n=1 Tax=Mojavia pulchra JT2-VF2 TaxID=287848 RepID=A0A951PV17_9NOST|nr:fasciclin domain-containing protein [Mojavia pulchra JT2-VF2]